MLHDIEQYFQHDLYHINIKKLIPILIYTKKYYEFVKYIKNFTSNC